MTTELPRDTLDLLPQRVIECGDNSEKHSFRCQDRRRPCDGNLHNARRWGGRARPGFWCSIKWDLCFDQSDTRIRLKDCMRRKTDDFSGIPKWCFNFMKREVLSVRTWTKVAPKLPAAYENQVLEFHPYVLHLWKTQFWPVPNRQYGWGLTHIW